MRSWAMQLKREATNNADSDGNGNGNKHRAMNDKETRSNNENGLTTTQRNDTHPQTHRHRFGWFVISFKRRVKPQPLMLLL